MAKLQVPTMPKTILGAEDERTDDKTTAFREQVASRKREPMSPEARKQLAEVTSSVATTRFSKQPEKDDDRAGEGAAGFPEPETEAPVPEKAREGAVVAEAPAQRPEPKAAEDESERMKPGTFTLYEADHDLIDDLFYRAMGRRLKASKSSIVRAAVKMLADADDEVFTRYVEANPVQTGRAGKRSKKAAKQA